MGLADFPLTRLEAVQAKYVGDDLGNRKIQVFMYGLV